MNRGAQQRRDAVSIPHLLFIERAVVAEPVAVEVDRPGTFRPRLTGFWRDREFHRIVKIVESRYELGMAYARVVTDHGCMDLRRRMHSDPRTLRARREWEICAVLDAVEFPEHTSQ